MVDRPTCPRCGMELPEVLLPQHLEFCTADGDVTTEEETVEPEGFPQLDDVPVDDLFPEIPGGTAEEREGSGGVLEPDLDDEFAKLVKQLDLSDIGPQVPDVVVTTLNDVELSQRYNQVRDELLARGEMINCNTQTGRDLHSQRAAYIIEMRRRGLAE